MSKKQRDIRKIFIRIMSAILAALMVLGICGTFLYYLISM